MHKLLVISVAPPENDCGCRVVLYRHLEENKAFDYIVATRDKWVVKRRPEVVLRLPYFLHRLEKSRFGPLLSCWIRDYENLVWPYCRHPLLDEAITQFQPDAILNLADPSLSPIALKAARRFNVPLVGMFNDWVPIMRGHYGHHWTCGLLSRRFRKYYKQCDLAFCTSDGMKEELGPHPNAHVLYPMPGRHVLPEKIYPPKTDKYRIVYLGSAEGFYGRMLCELIMALENERNIEIKIVTPNNDWPKDILRIAQKNGNYLGFMPPTEAASVLAGADVLLVIMSFEKEHELFMRTSFTTKYLDYCFFEKPIILWGPDYISPATIVRQHGGALHVNINDKQLIVNAVEMLRRNTNMSEQLAREAKQLHLGIFNPDRLQRIFTKEIENVIEAFKNRQ